MAGAERRGGYGATRVEARRATGEALRVTSETFASSPATAPRGNADPGRHRRGQPAPQRRSAPTPVPTAWLRARTAARGFRSRSSTGRRRSRFSTCRTSARAWARTSRWRRCNAMPLPGHIAAWTSPGKDRSTLATTLGRPAPIGRLVSPVHAGRFLRKDGRAAGSTGSKPERSKKGPGARRADPAK